MENGDPNTLSLDLDSAGADGYLGDLDLVETLIRTYIGDVAQAAKEGDEDKVMSLATDAAEIFAGMNATYTPVPDWHTAHRLGNYVAQHWNIQPELSLIETLRAMFLLVTGRVIQAIKMEAGVIEGEPRFVIDTTIEEAVAALTGTWEITYPEDDSAEDADD